MTYLMHWRLFFSALPLSGLAFFPLSMSQALAQSSLPFADPESSREAPSPAPQPIVGSTPHSPSLGQRDAYVLGAGDQVQVDVFNVPEFSASYTVLVDGTLSIPLLGDVDVQGMTLLEATSLLTQRYAPMLTRPPQVTVTLESPRPVRVAVAGEVRRPGSYDIEFTPTGSGDGSSLSWPTLTQVIQGAGGVTEQADVRRVQVIRPTLTGEPTVLEANLWDLIQAGDLDQDIRLRDGDRVIVSVATAPPEELIRIATANFSPDKIMVQVVGEVSQGGSIELPVNASLNQAILAAGGLDNPRVQSSSVELVRLNRDGTVLRQTYDVDLSAPPNDQNNPILISDDVVIVRRTTIARTTDWLNVLLAPFVGVSTFIRLFGF